MERGHGYLRLRPWRPDRRDLQRWRQTWVDGLVGVRGRYDFNENWYLTGWGMVGAGEADLDWDVAAGLGYRFNDTWSAVAGYRALGVDYSQDDFVFDVVQQGPILGVVINF